MTTTFSPRSSAHRCATVSPKKPEPTTTRSAFTYSPGVDVRVWMSTSGYPSSDRLPRTGLGRRTGPGDEHRHTKERRAKGDGRDPGPHGIDQAPRQGTPPARRPAGAGGG